MDSDIDGVLTALQLSIDMVEPEEAERIAERETRLIEMGAESNDKWVDTRTNSEES